MRKSIGKTILGVDQLITMACYAESVFNERPLAFSDVVDENFVAITPNTLIYGLDLRHFARDVSDIDLNDPDFVIGGKVLNARARKLKSVLARVHKVWFDEYLQFLSSRDSDRSRMSPSSKSVLIPKTGDCVLIRDDNRLRLGQVIELCLSSDDEIRSARVRTPTGENVFPVCNLRFLERDTLNDAPAPDSNGPIIRKKRVQRAAAARAQAKFVEMTLIG